MRKNNPTGPNKFRYVKYLDYVFVIALWLVIFGKNVFSNLMFVDYTPSVFSDFGKTLVMGNFTLTSYLFSLFKFILVSLGFWFLVFTFSILVAMLVSYFYIKRLFKEKGLLFSILFSLIFFFNPFVYSRIMIGQLGVLLAYLFLPVCLFYLFNMFKKLDKKSVIKAVIAFTITACFSIHFFAVNFLLFIVASFWFYFYKNESVKITWKKYAKVFVAFILLLIFLNAFWLQGFFSRTIFSAIDVSHEEFFSPKVSTGVSAFAKILGMYGFWREGAYLTIFRIFPSFMWYLMLFLLVILFVYGYYIKYEDRKAKFFFSLFWIGLLLGVGISHPYTSPLFDFLFKKMPFFNGFRDSHKLVSLIALAYAYFLPVSLFKIKDKLKKYWKVLMVAIFIAFILVYTLPLVFLNNQIKPLSYPEEYYNINGFFSEQRVAGITGYIIYLPWQNYLTYNWSLGSSSDGRISAPINRIIKQEVIIGSDKYGSEDILKQEISSCLANKSTSCLEEAGVQFIIKDKCAYFPDKYEWLNLSKVYSENCIEIYKLDNKTIKEKTKIPVRYIAGAIISLITLLFMAVFLVKKERKEQE